MLGKILADQKLGSYEDAYVQKSVRVEAENQAQLSRDSGFPWSANTSLAILPQRNL